MVKKGLGKGLDALFMQDKSEPKLDENKVQGTLKEIEIVLIDTNVNQPRKKFDETELAELAESIRTHGVLQPVIVSSNGQRFALIAGERRYRAARLAGLKAIPAIVKDADGAQAMEIALIENLQRVDLNPIEEASGIRELMDSYGLTQEKVSERIGKSRPVIANSLRLLTLPEEIVDLLAKGILSPGHARLLLSIDDDATKILFAKKVLKLGLSVRQLEVILKRLHNKSSSPKAAKSKAQVFIALETTLAEHLGTKVEVVKGKKKGVINIEFYGEDDLERIIEILFN